MCTQTPATLSQKNENALFFWCLGLSLFPSAIFFACHRPESVAVLVACCICSVCAVSGCPTPPPLLLRPLFVFPLRAQHPLLTPPAGASLLCVPYGGVSAVLVMPRGNLEGICPRLLVLAAITDALDARAYAHAWGLAVTNRCVGAGGGRGGGGGEGGCGKGGGVWVWASGGCGVQLAGHCQIQQHTAAGVSRVEPDRCEGPGGYGALPPAF